MNKTKQTDKATARGFEIIRHSTDSENRPIVDYRGTYISNSDAIKLRDDLDRLIPSTEHAALVAVAEAAKFVYKWHRMQMEKGNAPFPRQLESALDKSLANLAAVSQAD